MASSTCPGSARALPSLLCSEAFQGRAALKSVRAIPNPRPEDRRPKETRRPRSELIATPAEQPPIESGHSRNSGFGLRSSDFRAAEHALPATRRTLEQPCLRGALLGLEIGTSQGTLPIGAGRFGRAPHIVLSGAFLALRAPDCNGWLRDGLGDNGAIGTQEEPAGFRRNTRAWTISSNGS